MTVNISKYRKLAAGLRERLSDVPGFLLIKLYSITLENNTEERSLRKA